MSERDENIFIGLPDFVYSNFDYWGGHWGFADSGYRTIFGAEMRKLSIISEDCGYLLHFCGMRISLQN